MAKSPLRPDCPLTTKDHADIQYALAKLNEHRIKCEEAKRAGEDVEADIAMNDFYRDRFSAYKKVYFPNRP